MFKLVETMSDYPDPCRTSDRPSLGSFLGSDFFGEYGTFFWFGSMLRVIGLCVSSSSQQ